MTEHLVHLGGGMAALAGLAAGALLWLRVAAPLLRSEGRIEHWLDSALILCWLAVGFFYLLAGAGLFRSWLAVAAVLGSGLVARSLAAGAASASPRGDAPLEAALRRPSLRDPWMWAAIPVLAGAAVRLVKSMAAPPMSWDAMTVHLVKSAFWIQSGSLSLPDFPDAWTYYRWFPAAGEVLFAWVMLPFRGDLLLGPFGVVVWVVLIIAAARWARHLGANDQVAWLAGAALAGLPTVLVFMTANYVDNLVVLFVLLAVTHASLFVRTGRTRNAVLCLGAAGLAIGTKTSALVVVAPIVATIAVAAWRRRRQLRVWALPVMVTALVVPCVGYFHTWLETGSPLFPFAAPVLDLPFHQGLADLFASRTLLPAGTKVALGDVLERLFWSPPYGRGHMNFGVNGAVVAAAALAGLYRAVRTRGRAAALWLTLAGAALTTPLVFTGANLALRTLWIGVLGRHLLPAFAPVFLWAALAPGRGARIALAASLVLGSLHLLPMGWSPAMVMPALEIAAILAVSIAAAVVLERLTAPTMGPRLRWRLLAVLGVLTLISCASIRAGARYTIYRETARQEAFDAHPLHPMFATAASLWPLLDTPRDLTIAVTVGKDQIGHNQFFYPLLGSRLQNRLIYVPVAGAGDDTRLEPDERYARADPKLWLDRLDRASADLVVGLWPATPEREWLGQQPDEFEVVSLTTLGAPWVASRREAPAILLRPAAP